MPTFLASLSLLLLASQFVATPAQAGSPLPQSAGAISFSSDPVGLRDQAKAKHQASVVYVAAEWCGACHYLLESTLLDPQVQAAAKGLAHGILDVTTTSDTSRTWTRQYGIAVTPTVLLFDAKGDLVQRLDGVRSTDVLIQALKALQPGT